MPKGAYPNSANFKKFYSNSPPDSFQGAPGSTGRVKELVCIVTGALVRSSHFCMLLAWDSSPRDAATAIRTELLAVGITAWDCFVSGLCAFASSLICSALEFTHAELREAEAACLIEHCFRCNILSLHPSCAVQESLSGGDCWIPRVALSATNIVETLDDRPVIQVRSMAS